MGVRDQYDPLSEAFGPDGAPVDGIVFHPRAYVTLKAVIGDQTVDAEFVPTHVSVRRGSHNKAAEATVEIEGAVLPYPIRQFAGAFLCIYMGVVQDPEDQDEIKQASNLRFVGYVDDFGQDLKKRTETLKAQDLTRSLREHKPLLKTIVNGREIDPFPRYSDTLEQAIRRILSVVPGFDDPTVESILDVRDNEALKTGALSGLVTGRAVHGHIALKPQVSAWEAIETVCGIAVRHVGVELREIVVRTSAQVFRDADPDPDERINFIVGVPQANAEPPQFHKKFNRNRKGVKVVATDTETRKPVEAVWPPDGELRLLQKGQPKPTKTKTGKSSTKKTKAPPPPQRDVYELDPGAYTPAAMLEKAKQIWLERSLQECDGRISTPIWNEQLLAMENGSRFFIKVALDLEEKIRQIGDDVLASRFLQEQYPGMSLEAADVLLNALKKPLQDFWYCKEITLDWPGETLATVEFINLVQI